MCIFTVLLSTLQLLGSLGGGALDSQPFWFCQKIRYIFYFIRSD
ncbi:hypothetical protein NBRC111894_2458 [Sporolactobacillus inulinus]|uniref:Uncharacterized protein n=1 Tax=Sporolactobacillus inulinus TaxID=2078 RepID=A0A4Y1ZCZ0_9BACL|nr:hypothetical protein NBRC111894_2458 [Sporolactobacillus inulinus]